MDGILQTLQCGACRKFLSEPANLPAEQRKPCPSCGSMIRHFGLGTSDTLQFHETLSMKNKNPAGKVLVEAKSGDDLYRKTGKWMRKERVIDRVKNRYKELVVDPDSEQVMDHQDEPLSQHRGHGSAKPKRPESS